MASTGTYVYFAPLLMRTAPAAGRTITVGPGIRSGSFMLSSHGNTVPAGSSFTLANAGIPDGTVYTSIGLLTSAGDPVLSYADRSGITSHAVLSNTDPGLLDGVGLVAETSLSSFAECTLILTARGEVAVEALEIGDRVAALCGRRLAPVRWVEKVHFNCAQHPRPWDVMPVRISAGAFADDMPTRDLVLSPNHCVALDEVLIPIRLLVNNVSIVQEATNAITYWHVELERHDVLFAEGLPAETYLDTGYPAGFDNAAPSVVAYLHPRRRSAQPHMACAELVKDGPVLQQVRQRLAERAEALRPPSARGHRIVIERAGHSFHRIPAGTASVELASRHQIPHGERRRLGASLTALALEGVPIALDRPVLSAGFHEVEHRGGQPFRWTNGLGVLSLSIAEHDQMLELMVERLVRPKLAVAS